MATRNPSTLFARAKVERQDMSISRISVPTVTAAKAQAKRLRASLQADGTAISHAKALELVAAQHGYRDWNTLHAAISRAGTVLPGLGDEVEGRYLGHAFKATVVGAEASRPGWTRLSFDLERPVNVSKFASFSVLRKRIAGTLGPDGRTREHTSDGVPHISLSI